MLAQHVPCCIQLVIAEIWVKVIANFLRIDLLFIKPFEIEIEAHLTDTPETLNINRFFTNADENVDEGVFEAAQPK